MPARKQRPGATARAVVSHSAPMLAFAAAAEPHVQRLPVMLPRLRKRLPPRSQPRTFMERSTLNETPLPRRRRVNYSQQSHTPAHLRVGPQRRLEHQPNLTRAVQPRPDLNHLPLRLATRRYRRVISRLPVTRATRASNPVTKCRRILGTRRQRLDTRFSRVSYTCRSNGPRPLAG